MNKDKKTKRELLNKIGNLSKNVIRTFFIAVSLVIIFFVLVGVIYLGDILYNAKTGKNTVPLFGAYVVVTKSMIPTIKVNDAVVVKRVDEDNINIGDVITFSSKNSYYTGKAITHRIVRKKKMEDGSYLYETKGDNNALADESLVDVESIYGKVVLKIPKVGYIQKFILSPFGFVMSIVIPVVLVIVYEVLRIYKIYNVKKREIEML